MKNLLSYSLFAFLLFASNLLAQENYTVEGEQLSLKTEVDGTITLLWNTIDGEYRYFIKKGSTITELKNTKVDGHFNEEYKQVLLTNTKDQSISNEKVNLTTTSLKDFFEKYNKLVDPNFTVEKKSVNLKTRIGAFVGITNIVYSNNPENSFLPELGAEFEILDNNLLKRHSFVVQFRQIFENSEYKYSSSQFSLNYRFKFVKKEKLDIFINTKIAGYTSITKEILVIEDDDSETMVSYTSGSFQGLLNFGIGADYAIGNGYLTFLYGDIVSVFEDSNGEFPLDFTLGYKFNL